MMPSIRKLQTALKASLFFAAAFCSAQAHAQNCRDAYNAIKMEAMDCGFFCNEGRLKPLQAAYEAKCIVTVIPASAIGFDSSPEPSAPPAVYADAGLQGAPALQPLPAKSRQLLEIVQTINTQQFLSRFQRVPPAEAFLGYCKSALARIPYDGPRVGLTEESGDRTDAQLEFARWRLSTIFGDCVEAAYGIIDAQDVSQERAAWSKLTQFLEFDEVVSKLAINGKLERSSRGNAGTGDMFGTANWRAARAVILTATATLLADH